jgi:hypothetical protein
MRVCVRARVRARAWARAGVCVRLRACLCARVLLLGACEFGRMFTVCRPVSAHAHPPRTHVALSPCPCQRASAAAALWAARPGPQRQQHATRHAHATYSKCNVPPQPRRCQPPVAALPAPTAAIGLMDSALPVSSDYAISTSPSARRVVQDVGSAPVAQRPALRDISAGRFGRSAQEGAQLALPLGTSVGAPGSTRAPALGPHRADAIGWRRCGTSSVSKGQRLSCV